MNTFALAAGFTVVVSVLGALFVGTLVLIDTYGWPAVPAVPAVPVALFLAAYIMLTIGRWTA